MNTFKLLAIDPGKNIGVTVLTVRVDEFIPFNKMKAHDGVPVSVSFTIVNIETHYIGLDNLIPRDAVDKQLARIGILQQVMGNIMSYFQPDVLAIEEAFLNVNYATAVMQLSQYLSVILNAAINANAYIKLFRYSPKSIKSGFGAGGGANKDDMLTRISTITEYTSMVDITKLTEHEIDSMAIAHVALSEIRNYPFLLYT